MKLIDGLKWRYELKVKPHLMLHENPYAACIRKYHNLTRMHQAQPTCYIFADATNVGDRTSALGVQALVGRPGMELFAARAGLETCFQTLDWLQRNRPMAKIYIGGGGLLQECFVPFWQRLLETKLRFVLFGVGANQIAGERGLPPQDLMRRIATRAVAVHVRDSWSKGLLEFGQDREVTVGVCPAVNYLASKYRSVSTAAKTHLLHVVHPVDIRLAGGDPDVIRGRVRSCAALLGLVYDETDHIRQGLDGLCARYLRARAVVSSRLHGCIFSYALGVPFLPIITDRKSDAFLASHFLEHSSISVQVPEQRIYELLVGLLEVGGSGPRGTLEKNLLWNATVMADIEKLLE
jgi:hypothetical protein